jgi:serine/threonine protein phosphatase PrpC
MDGHGTFGHLVSSFLARHLPNIIHQRLESPQTSIDAPGPFDPPSPNDGSGGVWKGRGKGAKAAGGPLIVRPAERGLVAPFSAAFSEADRLLCGSGVDVMESGSTAVVCHLDLAAGRLVTAWVGDSRAVLATRGGSSGGSSGGDAGAWRVVPLSDDHKPERPDERVRILLNGGRVEQMSDGMGRRGGPYRGGRRGGRSGGGEGGLSGGLAVGTLDSPLQTDPNRPQPTAVWFRHINYPGLAMSRAFGDLPCRRLGVQPEPEVTVVELGPGWGRPGERRGGGDGKEEEELMLVIASDGVWEYMGESRPGCAVRQSNCPIPVTQPQSDTSQPPATTHIGHPHPPPDNETAVEVLSGERDATSAARALVAAATDRWREVDPNYIDDITAVCLRLTRER